jgi:hypothetical protein
VVASKGVGIAAGSVSENRASAPASGSSSPTLRAPEAPGKDDPAHPANTDLRIPPFLNRRGERTGTAMSWRDHLPIHPAAELFPPMSEPELRELGEDIKANGLRTPIVVYKDKLLDGRNRLDAMELVGVKFRFAPERRTKTKFSYLEDDAGDDCGSTIFDDNSFVIENFNGDPYAFVLSANLHRRHLTGEDRRDLIAKVLKAKPGESNRKIAKQTKVDHKTVAAVRDDLESVGEIPHLEKTVGADGKQYKSRARANNRAPKPPQPPPITRATGSDEIDVEQHRAKMARLDQSIEEMVTDFDRRVACVIGTALIQIQELPRGEWGRFFAALRDRLDETEREVLRDADDGVAS